MTRPLPRLVAPLLIVGAVGAMAAATWMAWPDPVIDFGRELYVPWRLTAGDALYRDIAYFNGPFSPYFNAMMFNLLGVSLRTLMLTNIAILAVALAMTYAMARAIAGELAALVACLTFVGIFAFGKYTPEGTFNWMAPYSHEMTHGTTLGLLVIYAGWRGGVRWTAVAGLAAGLAVLTKMEIALAAVGTLVTVLVAQRDRRAAIAAAAALVVPILIACILFGMPALGGWRYMLDASHHVGDPFLAGVMGVNAPKINIGLAFAWASIVAVLLTVCYTLSQREAFAVTLLVTIVLMLWWKVGQFSHLEDIGRGLVILMAVLAILVWWRRNALGSTRVLVAGSVCFAFLMLQKMLLRVLLHHYGFALALPATLVLIVFAMRVLPAYGSVIWLCILAVIIAAHVSITLGYYNLRTETLGSGGDAMRIESQNALIIPTLRYLHAHAAPGDSLAVFPEGVMVNYLARMPASTCYINFIPHEVNLYGEGHIIEALDAHKPTWIVLMHRDTGEYGFRYFGTDYATSMMQWIHEHYTPLHQIGPKPLQGKVGGALLARRND